MSEYLIFALVCALIAIAYGVWSISWLLKKPDGNEEMRSIASAIQQGASAYLNRQYTAIGLVGVVLFIAIWYLLGATTAIGFSVGAILSGAAGFIGMHVSVRSNSRTTEAAKGGAECCPGCCFPWRSDYRYAGGWSRTDSSERLLRSPDIYHTCW